MGEFQHRRQVAGELFGLRAAIPAMVARHLLGLGWRVDDSGAWVSPHDGRSVGWQKALDIELGRVG